MHQLEPGCEQTHPGSGCAQIPEIAFGQRVHLVFISHCLSSLSSEILQAQKLILPGHFSTDVRRNCCLQ